MIKETAIQNFLEIIRKNPGISYETLVKAFQVAVLAARHPDLYFWIADFGEDIDDVHLYLSCGTKYDYDCNITVRLGAADNLSEYIYLNFYDKQDVYDFNLGMLASFIFRMKEVWNG